MSLFVIFRKMRIRLERNSKILFVGRFGRQEKIHLVKWSDVCTNENFRGLRLRRLDNLNQTLLGKCLWRFSIKHESLWRKIICENFGEMEGGWTTRGRRDSFGMSLCRDIRRGWVQCQNFYPHKKQQSYKFLVGHLGGGLQVEKCFTLLFLGQHPTKMLQLQIYGKENNTKGDVGRSNLEDPSKIGRQRR